VRPILLASLVAAVVGASIALQPPASAQGPLPADFVFTNGKVITVDDQFSIAQAVAVRGDRIVAVGTNQEVNRLAGPSTRRIDLRGKSVMPGFIDNHAHFQEEGAYWILELRFDGITSRKQAWELMRAKAQASGPGKWVYNLGGWSPDQFVEDKKLPTRDELDKYSPENPVFLQASRAETFINSKAIEVLGLETMKEPWILRDANGRATGVIAPGGGGRVRDMAKFLDAPNGGRANLPADVIRASSIAMLNDLNKAGLTASGGGCQFEELHRELKRMRFFCLNTPPGGRGAGAVEKQIALIPTMKYHDGDEWSDRTNWGENFPGGGADDIYSAAQQPVSQEQWDLFGRFAGEVAKARIQAILHTQTAENIDGKLTQLEKLQAQGISIRPLRWMLMHMEGVTPPLLERMKKLNLIVGVHPREMTTGGLLHRVHGDKAFAMPPLKEIQDSGIKWGLGTDAFEVNQFRPFQTLYWATTGKMVGGTVVNRHPTTREAALIAHTRTNAYILFREMDLGSIHSGYFADLIVTDRDYLTVPLEQIKDIKVQLTMIGGRIVYDAAAEPATATR
jgi:predicted amidohydrolase YtcJ